MFVWRSAFGAALLGAAVLAVGCGGSDAASERTAAPLPAAAPAPPTATSSSHEGEWFVKTGCAKCHSVSVYGVKPEAEIGPDLSIAVEDVQTRFGVSLEEFFDNPSGTMALVLSSQIQLTDEEKKVAIRKLHEAFEAHQKAGGAAVNH